MGTDSENILPNLVVVIPTLDEELHIGRAARSAFRLGHVIVVDCGSSDGTRRLATELGTEVVQHAWAGYSAQKNWALTHIAGRFDWVLFLDADEWIPDDLAAEIRVAVGSTLDGFHLPRRNVFEGRVLRHAWWYPDYQLRLFRTARGRFEDRLVHEHGIVEGRAGFLKSPLMHENLKGLDDFIRRHARYADLEAQEMLNVRSGGGQAHRSGRLFGSWPERRRFLKTRIWYRMPFRPAIRFFWMFVIKRGFLDGRPGLVYCQLIAAYEAMIDAKLLELERGLVVGAADRANDSDTPLPALSCPMCRGPLAQGSEAYGCALCGRTYPVVDGIAVLLADPTMSEHDEVDDHRPHDAADTVRSHKEAQAEHFDHAVTEEFEITRPHGTPRLYRFFLWEKFRRATLPIGSKVVGASALVVCGGSGMDAEYLARAGARVASSDISLGAARRTRERARRYGLAILPIVADVERLPFADRAFDLVLVHDGLHHLEHPGVGLAEMARVARRWVSVTEPSRALATSIAVKAGLAMDREEAGNRVGRLDPSEVGEELGNAGFRTIVAERYAMYYRHEPGSVFRALSLPGIFPVARAMWRLGNAVLGRAGNKMVVLAERDDT